MYFIWSTTLSSLCYHQPPRDMLLHHQIRLLRLSLPTNTNSKVYDKYLTIASTKTGNYVPTKKSDDNNNPLKYVFLHTNYNSQMKFDFYNSA